jgi:hypothetical protein
MTFYLFRKPKTKVKVKVKVKYVVDVDVDEETKRMLMLYPNAREDTNSEHQSLFHNY